MKTSLRIGMTAAVLFAAAVPLLLVRADTRSERRVLEPAPLQVSAPTTPTTHPAIPGGGINSHTSGEVNTGENAGGVVTTGDEHLDVTEVNIGPTNNTPAVITPTPTPPPPTCDTRRSPTDCSTTETGRAR